jgi:hypothetical protein
VSVTVEVDTRAELSRSTTSARPRAAVDVRGRAGCREAAGVIPTVIPADLAMRALAAEFSDRFFGSYSLAEYRLVTRNITRCHFPMNANL